jgi:hypothetical protein
MNETEIQIKVEEGLLELPIGLRDAVRKCLVTPCQEERDEGGQDMAKVWIVAIIGGSNTCIGYSEHGYEGRADMIWGLLFLERSSMGDSGSWYENFQELVEDCGYF